MPGNISQKTKTFELEISGGKFQSQIQLSNFGLSLDSELQAFAGEKTRHYEIFSTQFIQGFGADKTCTNRWSGGRFKFVSKFETTGNYSRRLFQKTI